VIATQLGFDSLWIDETAELLKKMLSGDPLTEFRDGDQRSFYLDSTCWPFSLQVVGPLIEKRLIKLDESDLEGDAIIRCADESYVGFYVAAST
jgi:hypothetical protein